LVLSEEATSRLAAGVTIFLPEIRDLAMDAAPARSQAWEQQLA
jgi:hypothetical protein